MSSQKRDREVELAPESDTPHVTTKHARTDKADDPGKIIARPEKSGQASPHGILDTILNAWSPPITARQEVWLLRMMDELVRSKSAADFIKPHTKEHIAFYAKRIKGPLNLSTMQDLLDNKEYLSVMAFVTDFKIMVHNVAFANGKGPEMWTELWTCFWRRMRDCPDRTNGEPFSRYYGRDAIDIMASQVKSPMPYTPIEVSSEKLEATSGDDSNINEGDELQGRSFVDVSGSLPTLQNGSPLLYNPEIAKTPELDKLDEQSRQLQEEIEELQKRIEERQQKLADVAEKKRLLIEVRDLDTEQAAIDGEIYESNRQIEKLMTKVQSGSQRIAGLYREVDEINEAGSWHGKESERLRQESERLQRESERCVQASETQRKEKEKLRPVAKGKQRKIDDLQPQRDQVAEQGRHVQETLFQLKTRSD
jgi:FtsZ-binding cell division protein ZapB